jgi:hypothetical protein
MAMRKANWIRQSFGIAPGLAVTVSAVVTLAIVASLSYWLGRRTEPALRFLEPRRAPTVDEAVIAHPIEYALGNRESNDVVFLGDSTCLAGIDPRRLTGLRGYNLGSQGSLGPVGTLITAKAYLENHPLPRALVLCFTPFRFEVETGAAGGPLPARFVASYGPEVQGVVPLKRSVDYFLKRGAAGMLAEAERDVRSDPLKGLTSQTYWTLQRRTYEARGHFALTGAHGGKWFVEEPPPPRLILEEWDAAIRQIARLCNESGIALVILFSPIWDEVAGARDFSPLERWGRELESTYPHVSAPRPVVLAYARQFMWDAIHLNAAGTEKFMPTVAKDVQAALAR